MSYRLIMTAKEMEDTDKWLELRRQGIGGSEIGAILGYSPFSSAYKVWLQKTDPAYYEQPNERTAEYFYFGHKMEQVIADAFVEKTGIKVQRQGMIRCVEKPFAFANVDRVIVGTDENGKKGFLECKNVSSWKSDEWEDDELPSSYYLQCQWYCFVGDYDYFYIAALIGGNHLVIKRVERNEEDIKIMVEAAEHFWNEYVVNGKMPPVDGSEECEKVLKKKLSKDDGEAIELDSNWDMLLRDLDKYEDEYKTLGKTITEIKNKLRVAMGNSPYAETSDHIVTFKCHQKAGFDKKKLAKDYPKIYENYVTQIPVRELRTKDKNAKKRGKQ